MLNLRLRLFDLQLLHIRLLPNPPLFQVQVQPHTRLRALNLVPQPIIQFRQLVRQPLVARARQCILAGVERQQLRAQCAEVDFLRVRRLERVLAQHHCARKVLDGFFDDVAKHAHQGDGLLFAEAFGLQTLDEFQRVEVVVAAAVGGGGEGALRGA